MEICGKHNPTLVVAAQQTQTGRRWRSADGGWDPKAEWSYNVRPWKKVGIGALSENRFGDKSLGFQCGGGGRTNGEDRLGPRVLVELEAAEVQLSGGFDRGAAG